MKAKKKAILSLFKIIRESFYRIFSTIKYLYEGGYTDIIRTAVIIMIVSGPMVMQGCADSLELLPPDGLVKDEYWQSKEDVEATLMGAYKGFADIDNRLFYYGELRGDMLIDDNNLQAELRNIMYSNVYPENTWVNWKPIYEIINYCNTVLKYSGEVLAEDPTFTEYKFEAFNAEAVFLRSLAYFYLVRVFDEVPFVLNPFDSDEEDFFLPKTSSEIILDSLSSQLVRIVPLIPEEYENIDKTKGRATRGAVHSLLAEIALWNFDYEKCINHVDDVLDMELYGLLPAGSWFTIFTMGNTLEGIFEIQFNSQLGQNNSTYNITLDNLNYLNASDYAMDILSAANTSEIVRGPGSVTENQNIWKYVGQSPDGQSKRSGANARSCNWIVYRLPDVMLMKAEALCYTDRYEEAIAIVNQIRVRSFAQPITAYSNNPSAVEDIILEERAKELAFEGKRWFDLLRMGRRDNYQRKEDLIQILIRNVPATQKRVLATKLNDPNGWFLPIHSDEIENNPNLVQNPYYSIYERDE